MSKTKAQSKKAKNAPSPLEAATQRFEQGLDALYKKKWATARKIFAGVAKDHPGTRLAERSERFEEVCDARSGGATEETDTYLSAVYAKNDGDLETAIDICSRGGLKGRDERFTYLAAVIEELRENREEAGKLLLRAIEMNPANRVHAFHDPDLEALRDDPEFVEVFSIG